VSDFSATTKLVGKKFAREHARALLERHHKKIDTFVDVRAIAEASNLKVIQHSLPETQSGLLVVNKARRGVIVVNENHTETRQRFSIAHELGHYELHYDGKTEVFHRDERSSKGTNRQEIESNAFAAELLMPLYDLLHWVEHLELNVFDPETATLVNRKATQLRVSPQALSIRLNQLNLLDGNL
jgi:Zn-dependent peptidase ImmA (M78 family)